MKKRRLSLLIISICVNVIMLGFIFELALADCPDGCDDGNECTADVCIFSGCSHVPIPFCTPDDDEGPCPLMAIYWEGSEEIAVLRYFRDSVLSQTTEGKKLIGLYYVWSPVIVKAMEEDEEFEAWVKEKIDSVLPMIEREME